MCSFGLDTLLVLATSAGLYPGGGATRFGVAALAFFMYLQLAVCCLWVVFLVKKKIDKFDKNFQFRNFFKPVQISILNHLLHIFSRFRFDHLSVMIQCILEDVLVRNRNFARFGHSNWIVVRRRTNVRCTRSLWQFAIVQVLLVGFLSEKC